MGLMVLAACCSIAVGGAPADTPAQAPAFEHVELPHGSYWLVRPPEMDPDTRYPLIVCLHGTETQAPDILGFWLSLEARLPFILIAPQGVAAGWRDADLALIRELRSHIEQTLNYDPKRFLLTGHSAGGAMAFHLLYAEGFPATAVAVTANYVPPTVKFDMVRQRQDVPLFYAVGEADLNRPRMREGLALLRGAKARVTVMHPPIGHVLSRKIGQAALEWFESTCRQITEGELDRAREMMGDGAFPGPPASVLEEILRQRRSHFTDQVALAADLLAELQQPATEAFARAERLAEAGDPLAARDELLQIERRYQPSSIVAEAKKRRLVIEAMPGVAAELAAINERVTAQAAEELWQGALTALTAADLEGARRCCHSLVALYPDSSYAADARQVLEEIERVSNLR